MSSAEENQLAVTILEIDDEQRDRPDPKGPFFSL